MTAHAPYPCGIALLLCAPALLLGSCDGSPLAADPPGSAQGGLLGALDAGGLIPEPAQGGLAPSLHLVAARCELLYSLLPLVGQSERTESKLSFRLQ